METKSRFSRGFAVGVIAVVLTGSGADTPTRKIEVEGLSFAVPASWKSSKPASRMRLAELKVDAAEGDKEPAELLVFAFPGGGGTVEANIKRWQGFFKDGEG